MVELLTVIAEASEDNGTAFEIGYVLGVILALLIPGLIVAGIIWLIVRTVRKRSAPSAPPPGGWGAAPPPAGQQPADWYPDPWGHARLRWWDGGRWTDHTQA